MSEVEELKEQKRKIEARLRELKNGNCVICGKAKMDVEHYPTSKPDRMFVAIKMKTPGAYGPRERWRSILNGQSRAELADGLPEIIHDLQELYEKIKEDLTNAPE